MVVTLAYTHTKKGDPFYKSKEWYKTRQWILKRDNFTCVHCHLAHSSKDLQVDHIIPKNQAPHLAYHPGNLRTLCRRCHTRAPTSMGRGADYKERPFIDSSGMPRDSEWSNLEN